MKFLSVLAVPFILGGIVSAAGAGTFISYARPANEVKTIQTQLLVINGTAHFGNAKYSSDSEPLILNYPGGAGPGGSGGMSYTSFHSAQTGWQTFYIYPNDNKPIGFTTPHSAFVPPGAEITNFTVSATDHYLRYKNFDSWYACTTADPATYQVFYIGGYDIPAQCVTRIDIVTSGYGDCPW